MPFALSFADSEVSAVVASDGELSIHLSAASVVSAAAQNNGASATGYATGVVLRLHGFQVHEKSEPTFGRIRSGVLRIREQSMRSCALPAEYNTAVELELAFANGASMLVSASSFNVAFQGEPNFHESLAC